MTTRGLICALPLLMAIAPPLAAAEDPCLSGDAVVDDYLGALTERLSQGVPKKATELQLASRANSDGLSGGRLDLLRRAFMALDLGEISEEEGKLVFNFNPEALKLDTVGQFSPKVTVFQPTLFTPLEKHINEFPEDLRAAGKEALKTELGDLDDAELRVRWTRQSDTPEADIQEVANQVFTAVYEASVAEATMEMANAGADFRAAIKEAASKNNLLAVDTDQLKLEVVCADNAAAAALRQVTALLESKVPDLVKRLGTQLKGSPYFQIADLIEGQPQLTAEAAFRQREGAAGPDQWTVNVRWEAGTVSLNGFRAWARTRYQGVEEGGQQNVSRIAEYLAEKGMTAGSLPKFSVTAEYTDTSEFEIPIPGAADLFSQAGSTKLSGTLNAGWYFGGGRDRRLELAATYDDVSDDPSRQDRFVGTLSWVETLSADLAQLAGGSELVVSLVYGSKPEYRGDVDEDFSARAGLKWSLGGKQ